MKKFFLFLAIAAAAVCFWACTGSSSGPEKVAKKAIEALQKKDFDTYAATFNISPSDQKMLAGLAEEKVSEELDKKGGIKSYKITDCQVEEDKAKVSVDLFYKDGSQDSQKMSFVKVDGEWKQDIDK